MRVHLTRRGPSRSVDAVQVKRLVRAVLAGEGRTTGSVGLVLTGDAELHDLNLRFRGKDRPTDVLAFPMDEADDGSDEAHLGDVVVSVERAFAQAPRFHNTPEAELARLIVHGLLHLMGYDHHAPADGRRMKRAERNALVHHVPGALVRGAR